MDRLTPLPNFLDTRTEPHLDRGRPWPLGAHWDGEGVNFAVFSAHAQAIDLCLFDADGQRELHRLRLPERHNEIFHGYLRGAWPGLIYGLRAHGPWRPDRGHRFNPYKLLLDPYAREIVGQFQWRSEQFGADLVHVHHMDMRDNAAFALKARVVAEGRADGFDWQGDEPPRVRNEDLVLYEMHVKGYSKQNPGLPEALRGTYAGLAHPASISHLKRLGVTAVSLLPVHEHVDEQHLVARGLTNYWGYNTVGFFAPERRYAATDNPRDEFRSMVRALHAAGIEVILDVVYNHTAETGERGPTIAWRGLDNASYYRLEANREHYENPTGCGNALDLRKPRTLQMVLDSLRYWVGQMHVDGFRFDLAPVLGRGDHGFFREHPFFAAIAQDPLLARARMIAEPWDIGMGGYQVGNFPRGWPEWNDKFRDGMRAYWTGAPSSRGEFASRLCASSDVYHPRDREPVESVNFIVAHDGFTLRDLLSYNQRHNLANGEENRDGHGHNLSWNCGHEGPTTDPEVLALRAKLTRAMLATLLLAQGTPMLAAGDELGHSQMGNNNPYCQDNPLTWIAWPDADQELIRYTAALIEVRRRWLPLANRWYTGLVDRRGLHDLSWFGPDGNSLDSHQWRDHTQRALGAMIGQPGRATQPLLLLINAEGTSLNFTLPPGRWRRVVDSARALVALDDDAAMPISSSVSVVSRSVLLLSAFAPPA